MTDRFDYKAAPELIRVEDLHKDFGSLKVLAGITETIHKGEVVSLIGPSGSGKSTFLRCLNRLEEPTSGHIWFDGVDIADKSVDIDKHRQKAEVKLSGEGLNFSASEQSDDMYASIDLVTDKIESQVRKAAARSHERRKSRNANVDVYTYDVEEADGVKVVNGSENYAPKPLHLDEAVLQLDQSGNDFLVFLHADNERINVLYKKRSGDFGLIDPLA